MKDKKIQIRLSINNLYMLNNISKAFGTNNSEMIRLLIIQEYNRINKRN